MKYSLVVLLFLTFVCATSCKKEYTCRCTDPITGKVSDYKISTRTKTLAKEGCNKFATTGNCSLQ